MFATFKEQIVEGTDVQLWLITGKEVTGTVAEIGGTYVIIDTTQGQVTVFEKLLGGWEIKTADEKSPEESQDIPGSISLCKIDEMLWDFKKKLTQAELNLKPPDFSFPSHSLSVDYQIKNEIKKEWDKINSQFQYYLKIKKLTQLPQLAQELIRLGEKYPKSGAFYYNAGCFMSIFGQCSEAIKYFEKAFASEKLPQSIYNVACSAYEVKDYKKAHIALALYFNNTLPSSDIDAWYVFCNQTQHLPGYYALKEIVNSTITKITDNDSKIIDENYPDLNLLYKSIVYFLRENDKINEAAQIISLLDNRNQDVNKTYSLITSCLESLPQISCSEYEDALKLLYEGSVHPEKKIRTFDISRPRGYISNYNRNRNFGFLQDSSGTEYFFHRSAIVDDTLLIKLNNFARGERIPVVFETTQGPRGPVAIQISQYRTIDELFELAVSYADAGDYPNAIAQIKRVLALNPDYSNAKEFYEKWRDYARITGVPKGSNPYARARRVQLIEKDLGRAEQLLREAIARRDSVESAIKDLAQLLVQQGRSQEAIEVLERNRKRIRDQQSVDNLLIDTYQKAEQYDQAIALLRKKLKLVQTKEKRAQILWLIANTYLKREDYLKAKQLFEEVLKLRPDFIAAQRNIALCHLKQENYAEAERILNKILDTSLDAKAAELLEAITQARETGTSVHVDEIIVETSLSEFSGELSAFTQFFLNRCDFQEVAPDRIKEDEQGQKSYAGTEEDAQYDIESLEKIAKQLGTRRPHDRGRYYLSAARISLETEEDPNQFYKYLYRSFTSRGDAAVVENRPLDTARAWYCEALAIYDGIRVRGRYPEQDALNAIIRFLFSTLGQSQIPITPEIPSIDETLEEIINRHPYREKVFDTIAYLIFRSPSFAAERILHSLHDKRTLQAMTLEYLMNKGISVPKSRMPLNDFVSLWKEELRRKTLDEIRTISNELRFLSIINLTTAWLENAIRRIDDIEPRLLFDLDQQRVRHLQKILETSLDLCKEFSFEEQERLSIQIDSRCRDLLMEIKDSPTKLSVEEIYPVVESVQKKVQERLGELYETATPQITLRLPIESYIPDNNLQIEVQIVVENKPGRSPAESLELIVQEDDEFFVVNVPEIKLNESLRGGERHILEIPLQVTVQAVKSQTFSLPIYAQYRSRSEEIKQTDIETFSIRLYSEEEFKEIENPYAAYAKGGIVADPEMFYGREELIQNIATVIYKSRAQSKCIVVYGQKRAGKSSILHHLKKRLEKRKDMLILDLGDIRGIFDAHSSAPLLYRILRNILWKLELAIEDRVDEGFIPLGLTFPKDREFYAHPSPLILFKDVFDRYLRQASKLDDWHNVRIVVLIDEFSEIYTQIVAKKIPEMFMKNWKALLQENYFSAVLAGQDVMPKFKQRFPNEFGTAQDEPVSCLRREDAIKLIDEPIRIGGREGESRYREQAIKQILDLSARNPYYIQILCNRLVEYMNRKRAPLVTEAYVKHVKNDLIRYLDIADFDNLIDSGDTSEDAISYEDALKVLKAIAINSRTGSCNRNNITCETNLPVDVILDDLRKRDVIEREREQYYQIRVGLFKEWLIANQ